VRRSCRGSASVPLRAMAVLTEDGGYQQANVFLIVDDEDREAF
jgi:hypothetical protein